MSTLTKFLQRQFSEHCPVGWRCHHEVPVLSCELEEQLGYAPRAVSEPIGQAAGHRIFYAGDWLDVWTNVFRWNNSMLVGEMRVLWGKRTIKYFVFDPWTKLFAPSKFCAFLQVPASGMKADRVGEEAGRWSTSSSLAMGMTEPFYVQLDEGETRFDGAIAWNHLTTRLAMRLSNPDGEPQIGQRFSEWISRWDSCVRVHPEGPMFLLPPEGRPR